MRDVCGGRRTVGPAFAIPDTQTFRPTRRRTIPTNHLPGKTSPLPAALPPRGSVRRLCRASVAGSYRSRRGFRVKRADGAFTARPDARRSVRRRGSLRSGRLSCGACDGGRAKEALDPLTGPVEFEADVGYPGARLPGQAGDATPRRLLHAYARHSSFRDWSTCASVARVVRRLLSHSRILLSQCHHNCVMTKHPGHSSAIVPFPDTQTFRPTLPGDISHTDGACLQASC